MFILSFNRFNNWTVLRNIRIIFLSVPRSNKPLLYCAEGTKVFHKSLKKKLEEVFFKDSVFMSIVLVLHGYVFMVH